MTYLAISTKSLKTWDSDRILCLSPHVMMWDESFGRLEKGGPPILLINMEATMDYWRSQMSNLSDPWTQLKKVFEQKNSCTCTVAVADHPWRSLLLLKTAQQLEHGFLHYLSQKAVRVYDQISWSLWLETLQEWLKISIANRSLTRDEVDFEKVKKFKKFLDDMSFSNLVDFAEAHPSDVERRFGAHIALAWEWTQTENLMKREAKNPSAKKSQQEQAWYMDSLQGFFWQPAFIPPQRRVDRILDFVFKDWEWIKSFLLEDFKCLVKTLRSSESIVRLVWHVRSIAKVNASIDIVFRYPYRPTDTEASWHIFNVQAEHAYHSWRKQVLIPDEGGYSWSQSSLGLSEWCLEIADVFHITTREISLFDECGLLAVEEHPQVRELEMRLTCHLEKYSLMPSHIPEESFALVSASTKESQEIPFFQGLKNGYSQRWPLFIWEKPLSTRLDSCEKIVFSERVARAWWIDSEEEKETYDNHKQESDGQKENRQKSINIFRDFYTAINPLGRFRYLYKNPDGMWFEYGLFD